MPIALMKLLNLCMVNVANESQPKIRQGPGIWVVTLGHFDL